MIRSEMDNLPPKQAMARIAAMTAAEIHHYEIGCDHALRDKSKAFPRAHFTAFLRAAKAEAKRRAA